MVEDPQAPFPVPQAIPMRETAALTVHPLLRSQPEWPDEDPQFKNLVEDVKANGVIEPIKITTDGAIADGRHRWRAAKQAGIKIPAIVVQEEEVPRIILQSLIQRRHYSKGALAYIAYPMVAARHAEGKQRQLGNLKKGTESPARHSVPPGDEAASLAASIGVSERLFRQAGEVHEIFAKDGDYKAKMEPQILDHEDPTGLGAVIAGWAGKEATSDKPQNLPGKAKLFVEGWKAITKRWTYWDKMSADTREEVLPAVQKSVAKMPAGLRNEIKRAIKVAEAEEKAGA